MGRKKATDRTDPADHVYVHPSLGEFSLKSGNSWLNEGASVNGFGNGISVRFEGDSTGPSEDALEAYEWITDDPSRLWEVIQDDLFELYETYREHHSPSVVCESPEEIRSTAEVIALSLCSKENFEVTMTFRWQDPQDGHQITSYVEGGISQGHSVDG